MGGFSGRNWERKESKYIKETYMGGKEGRRKGGEGKRDRSYIQLLYLKCLAILSPALQFEVVVLGSYGDIA